MNWNLKRSYEQPGVIIFEYEIDGKRTFSAWDSSKRILHILEDLKNMGAENITYTVY